MRKSRFVAFSVAGITALLLGSAPLRADLAEVEKRIDAERVSLALKDASTKDLFNLYKDLLGVDVQYQCPEDRAVKAFEFENLTVRTSLDALCESTGLHWALEEGNPPVLKITCEGKPREMCGQAKGPKEGGSRSNPTAAKDGAQRSIAKVEVRKTTGPQGKDEVSVSIELKDAELSSALKMAARLLDAKLVMDSALNGRTLTLKMDEVPLHAFLDEACKQAGARWSVEGDPPVLQVDKLP